MKLIVLEHTQGDATVIQTYAVNPRKIKYVQKKDQYWNYVYVEDMSVPLRVQENFDLLFDRINEAMGG